MGNDPETTIAPGIPGDSHPARGMRLRLRFGDRELLVDERHSSVTIGRADNSDMVVKGRLISRLHARIEITHHKFFVLIDQSTNGTFVQSADGEGLFLRQDSMQLKGQGMIGLGRLPEQGTAHTMHFICEEV
jgi:adenylate cyclase